MLLIFLFFLRFFLFIYFLFFRRKVYEISSSTLFTPHLKQFEKTARSKFVNITVDKSDYTKKITEK